MLDDHDVVGLFDLGPLAFSVGMKSKAVDNAFYWLIEGENLFTPKGKSMKYLCL